MNSNNFTSETSIYIIDDHYRIVHFNRELQQVFPQICCGDICYEVFCGEKAPCGGCPLHVSENESTLFYNKKIHQWIDVSTGTIDWPGKGLCHVVLSKAIYEGNKNLFYNLTNLSAYDELFELNLTKDSFKVLFHLSDKYIIPSEEGSLSTMMAEVISRELVHPDDIADYLDFWNLDTIMERLSSASPSPFLLGQFRKAFSCFGQEKGE